VSIALRRPPWDLEAFGFATAEIDGAALAVDDVALLPERLAAEGVALGSVAVDPGDRALAGALAAAGFRHVETTVDVAAAAAPDPAAHRPGTPRDADALAALLTGTFRHGRYHADPLFPDALADRRYANWVRRALERGEGDVLVAGPDAGAPEGLVLVLAGEAGASIALGPVVRRDARGHGTGTALLRAALGAAHERGCGRVTSRVAADNEPVLIMYRRLGFAEGLRRAVWHHSTTDLHAPR
jgi:GNAT superfamily N-acetyltransferase